MLPSGRWQLNGSVAGIDFALQPRGRTGKITLVLPGVAELGRVGSGDVVVSEPREHVTVIIRDQRH